MRNLLTWLPLIGYAAAQAATPTNVSSYDPAQFGATPIRLTINYGKDDSRPGWYYFVSPLTTEAYQRLPVYTPHLGAHGIGLLTYLPTQHDARDNDYTNGSAVLNTPGNPHSATNLEKWHIAYTSCEPSDYSGEVTMEDVVQRAIVADVVGIVFYTRSHQYCNLSSPELYEPYQYMYTMTNATDSDHLFNRTTTDMVDNIAHLYSITAFDNQMNDATGGLGSLGGQGSTAVAMIILYSITGVITALFLVIIITGAIRAHRHPERYGPRNVLGRPRQSRAKGIARAMLDTLPIVKFGENREGVKDVEQTGQPGTELNRTNADGTVSETPVTTATAAPITSTSDPTTDPAAARAAAAGSTTTADAPTAIATTVPRTAHDIPEPENQGCSICTEDFTQGDDIRVLPCKHEFHPACVDPWLLDVSGTCPLCRVDLHPAGSNGEGENGELPPPLDPSAEGNGGRIRRRTAFTNFLRMGPSEMGLGSTPRGTGAGSSSGQQGSEGDARTEMRGADREQRLAFLRRWRQSQRRSEPAAESETAAADAESRRPQTDGTNDEPDQGNRQEDQRRRSRLGGLSRIMRRS